MHRYIPIQTDMLADRYSSEDGRTADRQRQIGRQPDRKEDNQTDK
jgi:hypothetical protein